MTAPNVTDSTDTPVFTKRGRKPKINTRRLLAEAQKRLKLAQEFHDKAQAQAEKEKMASLAKKGRQIYLSSVEQLHPGERSLLIDPVLAVLDNENRPAVEAWLHWLDQL